MASAGLSGFRWKPRVGRHNLVYRQILACRDSVQIILSLVKICLAYRGAAYAESTVRSNEMTSLLMIATWHPHFVEYVCK